MRYSSDAFMENAQEALQDERNVAVRDFLGQVIPQARDQAVYAFGEFDQLRRHMKRVRDHTLEHLPDYLAQFEEQARANGNQVHFAETPAQLNDTVLEICQRHHAKKVIKGKSMVTEETELNRHLQQAGLEVLETDLGEYIVQQAGEPPSHIVGPALHKTADDVRELFFDKHDLGERELDSVQDMVGEARQVLRQHFLSGDVGIIGANALIAENGYSLLVTNEGNGDLCANLPKVLIVCTTMERILPRAEDAATLLRLLVRSTTGQPTTCYTSYYSGPRRDDETDGPLETHIVLLDNKRSEMRNSEYRDMLACLRCGTCLNHCPVYIGVGGHAYGSVYPGPMGSVLTPLLESLEQAKDLPNACTSCGRCAEVCPADIPLPDLLRTHRRREAEQRITPARWRLGLRLHGWLARHPRLYRGLTGAAVAVLTRLGRRKGAFSRLPLASGWTSQRDFPTPQGGTFMQQYRKGGGYR